VASPIDIKWKRSLSLPTPNMNRLLFLSFLVCAVGTVFGEDSILVSRQSANQSCTAECGISLNSTLTCVSSPDPFCHCSDFLSGAQACSICLNATNTTLNGFFSASYVNFIIGTCNCQIPSCGNLTIAEKTCQTSSPNDPNCHCPATVQDGPVCYACLKEHITDPFVLAGLDANLAQCLSVVNNASTPATPSGSATSSQSSLPTFASEGSMVSVISGSLWIAILSLLATGIFGI
jgi:hypothetical protein